MSKLSDKHLNRRLLNAVIDENYKECQFLLNSGASPNHLFSEHDGGISSFHIAVGLENDLEFTRLFLNYNADVHLKCKKLGWTALHVCSHWNKHNSLQLLLLNKADPNIRCKNNKNVLQTAIENNSTECIQILREFMREAYLKVFTESKEIQQCEPDLDLTSVSSISLNDINSYSFVKTSTFDEIQLAESLADKPPPIPPRTHIKHRSKEHVYENIDDNNNKTPVKTNSSRFHSPEKLPTFHYKIIEERKKNEKSMINQETQTNSKCITIKQSDIKKSSPRPIKAMSPEDIINYYNKQQPEQIDNTFPAFNIYSKFKNWVSKLNLSPLIGNNDQETRQSRSRLQEQARSTACQQKSLSPTIIKQKSPKLVNQRASSLVNRSQKTTSPKYEQKEVSFSHLNHFITDEIGFEFFNSVLGKTNSTSQLTPNNKTYQIDSNEIKSSPKNLVKLNQEQINSSIITFDNSALLTNDELNQTKKSNSTFKTAQLNESIENDENDNTFTDNKQLEDLVKTFQQLNTNSLTEQLQLINTNLNESNKNSRNITVIENKKEPIQSKNNYSNELFEQIENKLNTTDSSEMILSNMFDCFQFNPNNIEWREGCIKSAFNYLLIDPRISQNLSIRAKYLNEKQVFSAFIASIFYIGKGTRARPYAHLQDSIKLWKNETNQMTSPQTALPKRSKKIERIISIWEENHGVVSLHCFQNVIPSEAYTREAAMIDAIGIQNLTNIKKGNYYGEAKEWTMKHKCQLGTILLRKACAIFLAEGERQLNPLDIKM